MELAIATACVGFIFGCIFTLLLVSLATKGDQ